MRNHTSSTARILFFGRAKCDASETLLKALKNYKFDVTYVESKGRGEKLPKDILRWKGEYIICFRSLFILPGALIDNAKIAAINFHPGPPEYPGSGCVNFALYDDAKEYGVTAHIINEKVDNGDILKVRRFPINSTDNLPKVLVRTHDILLKLCSDFIHKLSSVGEGVIEEMKSASKHEKWIGKAKLMKELELLSTVSLDVSKTELERIIRATYIKGYPPKIKMHGYAFYLKLDES